MYKFQTIKDEYNLVVLKNEILAGITTSLALIPEAIAFALVAHLDPITGLFTTAIICLIASLIGGRPGMISGVAGGLTIVSIALVVTHGPEYLYLAVIIMGLIEILVGVLRLAKFIRLVPQPVIHGFLNGLAIIIFLSQIEQFKTPSGAWLTGMPLIIMLILVTISILIMYFLPRITDKVPSGLVAIITVTLINLIFGLNTQTIGDIASISPQLPSFHIPMVPITYESIKIVLPYSILMASVGLIEALLTVNVVDEMTNTRGRANKESVAQGIANTFCGFFHGMGGCAMIGQTMVNLQSGGLKRLSGLIAGGLIFIIIMFGSSLLNYMPMAALIGVLIVVSIDTFKWSSLKVINHVPKIDMAVMIIVTILTVLLNNLAIAVLVGVIISTLNMAWQSSKRITLIPTLDKNNNIQYYEVRGPLFFASCMNFKESLDYNIKVDGVVINFLDSRIVDQSAIIAINEVIKKYKEKNIKVYLSHLSQDCLELLDDASEFIEINILEDPYYRIPSNELD